MPRIRTVKPDFFRHEALQDLEAGHRRQCPMLVFAGLWGHCDKAGRFEWKPRQLKLDILPFLPFDMTQALELLESHGFIRRYSANGKDYGYIPSFKEHQRIGGKEAQEPERFPEPPTEIVGEEPGKQRGSNGEATGIAGREGKGREEEGNKNTVGQKPDLKPQALEVLNFLNSKTGRQYEAVPANLEMILARLKEGSTADDLRAVVAKKCRDWAGDEKMAQYLRPKTLFNRTNYANYKGELHADSVS